MKNMIIDEIELCEFFLSFNFKDSESGKPHVTNKLGNGHPESREHAVIRSL